MTLSNVREWTPSQKQAIDSLDGTILVSAAAGSGKTAVLVQRIINRITDSVSPSSVDKLLVVTFTKAAAAEMKNRLSVALTELIEKDPTNSFLKRQKMYLSEAQISTMDSFCGKLVKDNFESLGISPDFSMLSDSDHQIMLNDVADEILGDIFESNDESDLALLELFTNQKNDSILRDLIIKMYDLSMADSDPEGWLDMAFSPYFEDKSIEESVCGKFILSQVSDYLKYILEKIDRIFLDTVGTGKLEEAVNTDLRTNESILKDALSQIENGGKWDDIRGLINSIYFERFTSFKKDEKDELYEEIKARRDLICDDVKELKKYLVCTADDYAEDIKYLRPIMSALKNRVIQFNTRLSEVKEENNTYYFSDVLHFTLKLLYDKNEDGTFTKTQLANELSHEFDEILIDEFQDTNEAQVSLFDAISKDKSNEFIVGDVKQSIYAFRQADPQIFVSLLNSHNLFDGVNYPAKISLDSNFRSRKGVIDAVNFFFDFLMLPKLGGLDYKKTERLSFGSKDYEEHSQADTEIHVVENFDGRKSNFPEESRYIGNLIQKMVKDKVIVGKKGEEHPVEYRDICILLRAVKNKANVMAEEFSKLGIPVHYKKDGGFFDNAEVMTVLSMLKVIDNPLQDVPLLSVLLSPLTSFTEDDVARLRVDGGDGSLYSLLKLKEDTDEKSKQFLAMLQYFRTLSVTLSVADLIRRIYEVTSFDCVVSAMNGGDRRTLNLQKFTEYAENYSANGNFGLSGFIRYIDRLQKNGKDLEGAETVSENDNVVRIMTIHKSKGLEFPVVILANTAAKFRDESKEKLPVNKTLGAGALRFLPEENREIETQIYSSVLEKNYLDDTAENLRLLYVALTRAKEKLIIVGSLSKPEEAFKQLFFQSNVSNDTLHVAIRKSTSFFSWILMALARNNALSSYPFISSLCGRNTVPCDSFIDFHFCESFPENEIKTTDEKVEYLPDEDLVSKIKEKVSFVYPFDYLSGVDIKYTASSMDKVHNNEYFASENPSFISKEKITPAMRGTLIHKFMEVCDMKLASINLDAEIERLISNGAFTVDEQKILDGEKLSKFFKSDMFNRIISAENFFREKEFTMSVPLCYIKNDMSIPPENLAVVQGVIDGLIINGENAEIVDYKTDRVKSAQELCERYKTQMLMYKKAAEECFGAKNVKVTLYSFELSQEISVKFEKNT